MCGPVPAMAQEEEVLADCTEFLRFQESIFPICEVAPGQYLVYNLVQNRVGTLAETEFPPGAERIGPGHEDYLMLANFATGIGSFAGRLAYERGRVDERAAQVQNLPICQRISYGDFL